MCHWFEDDLLDGVEAFTDDFSGFLKETAVTIGRIARQAAPIATAIPIPQTQLIGAAAGLITFVLAEVIDALADEWSAGLEDRAR
jgi:hypothetical protein